MAEAAAAAPRVLARVRHPIDIRALEDWLADAVPAFGAPVAIHQFDGGQSNPTYRLDGPSGSVVLRRKPPGVLLKSAHAIDREFLILRRLTDGGLPVPEPLAFCEDPSVIGTSFYVMRHVEGRIYWDPRLPDVPVADRAAYYRAMAETLAQIHRLDVAAAGLSGLAAPGDYFRRQLDRWTRQYLASVREPVATMSQLAEWLAGRLPPPAQQGSLVHGDFRLDNLIFHPDEPRVLAVIDWEIATVGDPLGDLAYQAMQWRLPPSFHGGLGDEDRARLGLPGEEDYLAWYRHAGGHVRDEQWVAALVFSFYRFAAILFGVRGRMRGGTAVSDRARHYAELAEPVAEQGWQLARTLGEVE